MTKENKKPAKMLRVFNHKGQSIVEFALLCAFCVGVGLIVRETNLVEALGASFSGTGTHAAPTAIVAGETTHAGSETYTITKTINGAVPNKQNYTSGSEEANSLNFLKDLQDYYTNNPTGNAIEDDIWNAYKGTKTYTDEPKAKSAALALLGNNLTGNKAVADAVWKDLKKANDWAFDKDDATINNFLNDFFGTNGNVDENDPKIAELKKRNIFFANLSNQQIATMANNRNHKENFNYTGGDAVYEGYLAIKKQFWSTDASGNNTAMTVALDLAPVITDAAFAATSDEKKIFNYVNGVNGTKGVVPYFEQYASAQLSDTNARLQKELDVFKLNNPYAVDDANDDNDNLTTAMFSVTKIENVSDDYWIQIKKNIGWVRDADDNTIKNKLNEFVGQIKTDLEDTSLANDSDEVVEELVKRQAQFKIIGSTDAGKATIKKMISNLTEDKLNADAYKGYLAIKKQFWAKGEYNIALSPLSSAGVPSDIQLDKNVVNIAENDSFSKLARGDVFTYNDKYYICISYYTPNMNKETLNNDAVEIFWDKVYDSEYLNTADPYNTYYKPLGKGSIVLTGNNDSEVWVVLEGNDFYRYPFNNNNNGKGLKIGTKAN